MRIEVLDELPCTVDRAWTPTASSHISYSGVPWLVQNESYLCGLLNDTQVSRSPRHSPPFLHTTSEQRLEVVKATYPVFHSGICKATHASPFPLPCYSFAPP